MIEDLQQQYIDYLTAQRPLPYKNGKLGALVRYPGVWKSFMKQYPIKSIDFGDRNVWLWSDHHFGHKNIIGFSDRPYSDIWHMGEDLVKSHNCFVQHDDVCIFVGDFAFLPDDRANDILARMLGHKVLIIGNHDIHKKKLKQLNFDEIYLCAHMEVDGLDFFLSHYPWREIPDGYFNIHGHEHVAHLHTKTLQHFNVNCELHEYCPIMLNDIVHQAKIRIESM